MYSYFIYINNYVPTMILILISKNLEKHEKNTVVIEQHFENSNNKGVNKN